MDVVKEKIDGGGGFGGDRDDFIEGGEKNEVDGVLVMWIGFDERGLGK
ncbi:hypothetical protein [Bacillus thuringiensis]|nr:hypothetical protein [Bacillus thuringiensis]